MERIARKGLGDVKGEEAFTMSELTKFSDKEVGVRYNPSSHNLSRGTNNSPASANSYTTITGEESRPGK